MSLKEALLKLHKFLDIQGVLGTEFMFASFGSKGPKDLMAEAIKKDIFVPSYLKEWANLQKIFPSHLFGKSVRFQTHIEDLPEMLDRCNLTTFKNFKNGLDTSINIARSLYRCGEKDYFFRHHRFNFFRYSTSDEKADQFVEDLKEIKELPLFYINSHKQIDLKPTPLPEDDIREPLDW
jgi:hypothetical protein